MSSKADQAAELVREFPDLEGHIGAEYARLAGYPEAVCAAIDEQYLPDSAGGQLPETEAGRVLAAADKLDNLTVAFALGQRPTGSRDPYGLRRAAIGLCRLALEAGLELDISALVERDRQLLTQQGADATDDPSDVVDFAEERLEGLLDVPVEFVRAARELGPPVDRFFDEVLVMAEDSQVRANRLRLLLDVRDAVGALGDLSQIPR